MRIALPLLSPKNSQGPSGTAGLPAALYLSHFRLQNKPFDGAPDPRFLWLGRRLKRTLLQLRYEILRQDGWVVITGDAGSGKTTLAAAMVNDLRKQALPARVSCPEGGSLELFSLISSAFDLGKMFPDRDSCLAALESFLRESFSTGKKPVLILDDAERLAPEHLADLAHLSDLGENDSNYLNLVLVGQNELQQRLAQESHRSLRPRIIFNYHLPPLTREETGEYVLHRLRIAREGGESAEPGSRFSPAKKEIFTLPALTEVFLASRGIPRLINTICDSALLTTYAERGKKVLPQTIKRCAQQLQLPVKLNGWMREGLAPRLEGKVEGVNSRPRPSKFNPRRIRQSPARRTWIMISCGAAGFLVILGAFLFFFPQEGSLRQNAVAPLSKGSSPSAAVGTGRAQELIKKTVPPAGPLQALVPNAPERTVDPIAPPRDSMLPAKVSPPGKESPGSPETEKRLTPAPKAAPQPAHQAPSLSPRKEKDFLAKGQELLENGIAFSEGKKGKISQSPEPKAAGPPAPGVKGAEEADPEKAIDWLLEKKGIKKE